MSGAASSPFDAMRDRAPELWAPVYGDPSRARCLARVEAARSALHGTDVDDEDDGGYADDAEEEAEPEAVVEEEVDEEVDALELLSPEFGQRFEANSVLRVKVRASDRSGIARVELGWAIEGGETHIFACDALPTTKQVRCRQRGDVTVFELEGGAGRRGLQVRVTDGAGNQRVSRPVLIGFR